MRRGRRSAASPSPTSASHGSVDAPDGAREALARTVAALQEPASYPGQVEAIEAIETHMSIVLLTEEHAYKLKKPIRTALLDHTTIEARRRACETELELNRRLAGSVYFDVVPVVRHESGLRVEGVGAPIDWLVKMRRLPRDRMLDACIARDTIRPIDVDRLAEVLVGFYSAVESAPMERGDYRDRFVTDIEAKKASLEAPHYGLNPDDLHAVVTGQNAWLDAHRELIGERAASVVDAHGDLRPEHVCLERKPVVIDCLEFCRNLRLLDPVSELSFFALECRRLGASWVGERLLANYRQLADDPAPASLIAFYQSYHALVRAAIAVWHLDDHALDHSDAWRAKGSWYLRVARDLV